MVARVSMLLAGAAVALGLPLAAHGLRRASADRCALDGLPIDPLYRVRATEADGTERSFCCYACAMAWADRRGPWRRMLLTDEATGREVDAARAWLVRSRVVTQPITGNRIHAFARRADAERHAREAGGALLRPDEIRHGRTTSTPAGETP